MVRNALAVVAAAVLLSSPPTQANAVEIGQIALGYTYYNRPGATVAEHNSDLAACISDTALPAGVGLSYTNLATQVASNMIWSGVIAGLSAASVENCMIVKGWRVVQLADDEGRAVAEGPSRELVDRLGAWIGESQPRGRIVRGWGNEAAHPADVTTASRPAAPDSRQLSFRLYASSNPPKTTPVLTERRPKLDARWSTGPITPERLSAVPADAGVIVVRATVGGLTLERMGNSPDVRPSYEDHAPDLLLAARGVFAGVKDRDWFVFVVPPGRWRITSSSVMSYCFGAPSFEVRPGEVVYAGAFDVKGSNLGPDLALEAARTYLGAPLESKVKAAAYMNGSRGSCHRGGLQYALEIPGAPFASDYRWGTVATKRSGGRP